MLQKLPASNIANTVPIHRLAESFWNQRLGKMQHEWWKRFRARSNKHVRNRTCLWKKPLSQAAPCRCGVGDEGDSASANDICCHRV